MSNKALLEEISKQYTILDYHIKRLRNRPEQLHEIDIDLLSEKIKEIYTLVHTLAPGEKEVRKGQERDVQDTGLADHSFDESDQHTEPELEISADTRMEAEEHTSGRKNAKPESSPETLEVPDKNFRESDISSESEDLNLEEDKEESAEDVMQAKPEIIPGPEMNVEKGDGNSEDKSAETEIQPASVHTPVSAKVEERRTTADLFSGTTTIADTYQAAKDNSIAANVVPNPVKDLRMAIGINDKFLFINELFNGDPAVYNQAIEKLNSAGGGAEAGSAMNHYRSEFGWADNSEAYHRLKKIVRSKYEA